MKNACVVALLAAGALWTGGAAQADGLRLARIFSSDMVLQREMPVPVWGWARPGETVTVAFGGQSVSAVAGADGRWTASLAPLMASQEARPLTATAASGAAVTLSNVLVGEVWIDAGQSNMDRIFAIDVKDGFEAQKATVATANDPMIRFIKPDFFASYEPMDDFDEFRFRGMKWDAITTQTILKSSSLPYYFAENLRKKLHVPLGLVQLAVSGTNGLAWTRQDLAERDFPEKAGDRAAWSKMAEAGFASREDFLQKEKAWREECAQAVARGDRRLPEWPEHKPRMAVTNQRTVLYNALVHPCGPLAARGVIWHQGEGGPYDNYHKVLENLAVQWREQHGAHLAFIWGTLALAPGAEPAKAPGFPDGILRGSIQGQILANYSVENGGCVNFLDLGDGNLHWGAKDKAGNRMAAAARALCYGEKDLVWQSPQLESMTLDSVRARLKFKHAEPGLKFLFGDGANLVSIAGEDGLFHWANVSVEGNELVVGSEKVAKPVEIMYGWTDKPVLSLISADGRLAFPFYIRNGRPASLYNAEAAARLGPRKRPE